MSTASAVTTRIVTATFTPALRRVGRGSWWRPGDGTFIVGYVDWWQDAVTFVAYLDGWVLR